MHALANLQLLIVKQPEIEFYLGNTDFSDENNESGKIECQETEHDKLIKTAKNGNTF